MLEIMELDLVSGAWTIQDVVNKFVRPKTAATKCCLFDLVPERYVARPHFFVSHTWSRKYIDLMRMRKTYLGVNSSSDAAAGVILWLDIIAINQHPYKDRGCLSNKDVDNLAKVVHATDRTLFCLDKECVALSRIWCIYEVWQTVMEKGAYGLRVLMPEVKGSKLAEVFKTFDVMKAEATQEEDRIKILADISKSDGGAASVNMKLKRALVDSAQHEAEHTAATGLERVFLLIKAGDILMADGQHTESERYYQEALKVSTDVLGDDKPDTLKCFSSLATCLEAQGKTSEQPVLTELYAKAFDGLEKDRPDIQRLLAVLAAARDPLSPGLLHHLGMDGLLENLPLWGTLFYLRDDRVHMVHPSLLEFTRKRVDMSESHRLLVKLINVTGDEAYGLQHGVAHTLQAGDAQLLQSVLLD